MNITLTAEIEQVLSDIANKQGTTVELLALKTLREHFYTKEIKPLKIIVRQKSGTETLADLLSGYIGKIDSSEFFNQGTQMSKNTGKKFNEILTEKHLYGKL